MTRRQTSGSSSQVMPLPPEMPALFTRMSIRPCLATVAAVALSTDAASVSSTISAETVPNDDNSCCATAAVSRSTSHRDHGAGLECAPGRRVSDAAGSASDHRHAALQVELVHVFQVTKVRHCQVESLSTLIQNLETFETSERFHPFDSFTLDAAPPRRLNAGPYDRCLRARPGGCSGGRRPRLARLAGGRAPRRRPSPGLRRLDAAEGENRSARNVAGGRGSRSARGNGLHRSAAQPGRCLGSSHRHRAQDRRVLEHAPGARGPIVARDEVDTISSGCCRAEAVARLRILRRSSWSRETCRPAPGAGGTG